MPLVVFDYVQPVDNSTNADLIDFEQKILIPREALDKEWTLRSVQALYYNNENEPFGILDVYIPELMGEEDILFVCKGVGVEPPKKGLRFHKRDYQLSLFNNTEREYSCFSVISEFPDLKLGNHSKENEHLTLIVNTKLDHGTKGPCKLNSYSIILEYEE